MANQKKTILKAQIDGNICELTNSTKSHKNLLDNWYFRSPINQRGEAEFNNKTGYWIDRWVEQYVADGKKSLTNKGLQIICDDEGGNASGLMQYLDRDPGDYSLQTLTLSILINEIQGRVKIVIGYRGTQDKYSEIAAGITNKKGIFSVTGPVPDISQMNNTPIFVRFYCYGQATCTIEAVKLEIGDMQTLGRQDESGQWILNDPPPDKGIELLKCQRYYEKGVSRDITAMVGSDKKHSSIWSLRAPKRVTPTVVITNPLHNGAAMDINISTTVHSIGNGWYGIHLFTDHDAFEPDDFTYSFEYEASADL